MLATSPILYYFIFYVLIVILYILFLKANVHAKGRGSTHAELKKKNGYSRVPLEQYVRCYYILAVFQNKPHLRSFEPMAALIMIRIKWSPCFNALYAVL